MVYLGPDYCNLVEVLVILLKFDFCCGLQSAVPFLNPAFQSLTRNGNVWLYELFAYFLKKKQAV